MNVYCAHTEAKLLKTSNYIHCPDCKCGWYMMDPAPLVIIGVTSAAEVNRYPFQPEEGLQ